MAIMWFFLAGDAMSGSGQAAHVASPPSAMRSTYARADGKPVSRNTERSPLSAAEEIEISVRARLIEARATPHADGELVLKVSSQIDGTGTQDGFPVQPSRLIIELPLSSTADAYGESRQCSVAKNGAVTFRFRAGLDEKNFVPFLASQEAREFRFSLNKYFCRALAASFQCRSTLGTLTEAKLPSDMSRWKVGAVSSVELESTGAPARVESSPVALISSGKPFDYATCAVVAPSNGLCCVQHRTTEWHCGGTPAGEGWHQVSGDCYHRETGTSCEQ